MPKYHRAQPISLVPNNYSISNASHCNPPPRSTCSTAGSCGLICLRAARRELKESTGGLVYAMDNVSSLQTSCRTQEIRHSCDHDDAGGTAQRPDMERNSSFKSSASIPSREIRLSRGISQIRQGIHRVFHLKRGDEQCFSLGSTENFELQRFI